MVRAAQHAVDNLRKGHQSVSNASGPHPIARCEWLDEGDEAVGGQAELEQELLRSKHSVRGSRRWDADRLDKRMLLDTESRDAVRRGVEFVAQARYAIQRRRLDRPRAEVTPVLLIRSSTKQLTGQAEQPSHRAKRDRWNRPRTEAREIFGRLPPTGRRWTSGAAVDEGEQVTTTGVEDMPSSRRQDAMCRSPVASLAEVVHVFASQLCCHVSSPICGVN